jgi:outer membrane protein assembly factor BamB
MEPNQQPKATEAKPNPAAKPEAAPTASPAWTLSAIAGAFCLILAVFLAVNHFQKRASDPLNSNELAALKAELSRNPTNDQLKQRIRATDYRLRSNFDRHQARYAVGAWLLAGGMAVFVVSIKTATHRKKLPRPVKKVRVPGDASRAATRASWAVGGLGAVVGGLALVVSMHSETNLTERPSAKLATTDQPASSPETIASAAVTTPATQAPHPTDGHASTAQPAPAPTTPLPTADEIKKNWPRFRGPGGNGVSAYTNYPTNWNVATGEGILWKVEVPIPGPNSAVLWGDRLFLAGATAKKREVYCYDALSGKLLWQKPVDVPSTANQEPPTVMEDSGGFAPSTVATDGRRVYAIFATGDVGAFDFNGVLVWAVSLGKPDNSYGHSSSLEIYQDRLIVQYDQGNAKDLKSKVLALNTLTGQIAWTSQPRPVPNSWATPILIDTGTRQQIITCANPWVIAYDPAKGDEIWRAKVLYGEVTPSPIFGNGLVFAAIEGEKLSAIRPDGAGDVTKTHVAWSFDEGLPEIPSPLCDGKRVYLLTSGGTLTCVDAQSGKKLWDKELELGFKSSPGLAGDRIYLFSDKSTVVQVQAGNEFKELARCEMGEEFLSSPSFADGRLYIRGKKTLFCIGQKAK